MPRFNNAATMPAGTYVLGDPCYVVPNSQWSDWCDITLPQFDKGIFSPFEFQGVTCIQFPTAYGDGTYTGSDGFEYGVDSGSIGLVPKSLDAGDFDLDLSNVVTFEQPFTCYADYDEGTLTFGHIVIDTR